MHEVAHGSAGAILGLALLCAPALAAQRGGLCYIERVVARRDGVAVAFSYGHQVTVHRAPGDEGRTVRIGPGRRPLRLSAGESATISNAHDGCTLTVAARGRRRGLLARAWAAGPDGEFRDIQRFFRAEARR